MAITLVRQNALGGVDRDLSLFDCRVALSVSSHSCHLTFDFNESGVIGDDELVAYWTALLVLNALSLLHPDLEHGPPGPHWDWIPRKGRDGFRIFPDGSVVPKKPGEGR